MLHGGSAITYDTNSDTIIWYPDTQQEVFIEFNLKSGTWPIMFQKNYPWTILVHKKALIHKTLTGILVWGVGHLLGYGHWLGEYGIW
jgi:hypothetical protein